MKRGARSPSLLTALPCRPGPPHCSHPRSSDRPAPCPPGSQPRAPWPTLPAQAGSPIPHHPGPLPSVLHDTCPVPVPTWLRPRPGSGVFAVCLSWTVSSPGGLPGTEHRSTQGRLGRQGTASSQGPRAGSGPRGESALRTTPQRCSGPQDMLVVCPVSPCGSRGAMRNALSLQMPPELYTVISEARVHRGGLAPSPPPAPSTQPGILPLASRLAPSPPPPAWHPAPYTQPGTQHPAPSLAHCPPPPAWHPAPHTQPGTLPLAPNLAHRLPHPASHMPRQSNWKLGSTRAWLAPRIPTPSLATSPLHPAWHPAPPTQPGTPPPTPSPAPISPHPGWHTALPTPSPPYAQTQPMLPKKKLPLPGS